jgi:hypothetical protein
LRVGSFFAFESLTGHLQKFAGSCRLGSEDIFFRRRLRRLFEVEAQRPADLLAPTRAAELLAAEEDAEDVLGFRRDGAAGEHVAVADVLGDVAPLVAGALDDLRRRQ